jgi:hypothetical protein
MMWGCWMHVVLMANYVDLTATFELELMGPSEVYRPPHSDLTAVNVTAGWRPMPLGAFGAQ